MSESNPITLRLLTQSRPLLAPAVARARLLPSASPEFAHKIAARHRLNRIQRLFFLLTYHQFPVIPREDKPPKPAPPPAKLWREWFRSDSRLRDVVQRDALALIHKESRLERERLLRELFPATGRGAGLRMQTFPYFHNRWFAPVLRFGGSGAASSRSERETTIRTLMQRVIALLEPDMLRAESPVRRGLDRLLAGGAGASRAKASGLRQPGLSALFYGRPSSGVVRETIVRELLQRVSGLLEPGMLRAESPVRRELERLFLRAGEPLRMPLPGVVRGERGAGRWHASPGDRLRLASRPLAASAAGPAQGFPSRSLTPTALRQSGPRPGRYGRHSPQLLRGVTRYAPLSAGRQETTAPGRSAAPASAAEVSAKTTAPRPPASESPQIHPGEYIRKMPRHEVSALADKIYAEIERRLMNEKRRRGK